MTMNSGFEKTSIPNQSNATGQQATGGTSQSDLEAKLNQFAQQAIKVIVAGVGALGGLARDNRDKLDRSVDKAGAAFDRRTNGKYAGKVAKATTAAHSGVAKAADLRRS